jgi:hypothetical protein
MGKYLHRYRIVFGDHNLNVIYLFFLSSLLCYSIMSLSEVWLSLVRPALVTVHMSCLDVWSP